MSANPVKAIKDGMENNVPVLLDTSKLEESAEPAILTLITMVKNVSATLDSMEILLKNA